MARRTRRVRFAQEAKTCSGKRHAESEHRCADGDVRGCNISCFVAPNYPCAECDLAGEKEKPGVGETRKQAGFRRALPGKNHRCDYAYCDEHRNKTMRKLQPNLECGHVRQRPRIAP